MKILVTGGAGFIGSHTTIKLIEAGYDVVILDNFSNSTSSVVDRLSVIQGRAIQFYKADVANKHMLRKIFSEHMFDAVIHFAGLKSVAASVLEPLNYYRNNLYGTISLCEVMSEFRVHKLVFSSSATVYGNPSIMPIKEDFELHPLSPYGRSKLMVERVLEDVSRSDSRWSICSLRYFNPVGAHNSGLIGEDPAGTPNNLMPFVSQVAIGRLPKLMIFGGDYDTPDGTGVRDYIHVMDLAVGHLSAINSMKLNRGIKFINLGTGQGRSVLEMVNEFSKVSGKKIPYEIVARRPGDISVCYADSTFAKHYLGWEATLGIKEMCEDLWRWQRYSESNLVKRICH